jgi:hypothetical protein
VAKWHDYPNKNSLINDENNLVPIFWGDHDLVITEISIQKRINLMLPTSANTFLINGKGYGSFLVATLNY